MSSFMSRFGLNKKTSESPAVPKNNNNANNTSMMTTASQSNPLGSLGFNNANNNGSRNHTSVGPIKANTQMHGQQQVYGAAYSHSSIQNNNRGQSSNNNNSHLLTISNMGNQSHILGDASSHQYQGMYAIQTDVDATPSKLGSQ